MDETHKNYVRDLVTLLHEAALEAQKLSRAEATGAGFEAGRAFAYGEVLALMQSQADRFNISRKALGMDHFDATTLFGAR